MQLFRKNSPTAKRAIPAFPHIQQLHRLLVSVHISRMSLARHPDAAGFQPRFPSELRKIPIIAAAPSMQEQSIARRIDVAVHPKLRLRLQTDVLPERESELKHKKRVKSIGIRKFDVNSRKMRRKHGLFEKKSAHEFSVNFRGIFNRMRVAFVDGMCYNISNE